MSTRAPCFVPLALAFAAALPAQAGLCVSGLVERLPGPTICQQGETHWFAGTAIYLRSTAVNLAALEGRVVQVQGVDIGLLCRVIDVRQVVDPAPTLLVQCGSPMLGCPVKLVVTGPGLGFGLLAAATATAFQPLGCAGPSIDGTLQLANGVVLAATTTGTGRVEHTLAIPASNALTGVTVYCQGAHMTIGPVGPFVLTNVEQFTTGPLLPPCLPTNC